MLKIKAINNKRGFTKNQLEYIANEILKEINKNVNINEISKVIKNDFKNDIKEFLKSRNLYYIHNLYLEGVKDNILTIKVIDSNFKIEILNTFPVLMEYLKKLNILVCATVEEITEEEEKELNKINSEFIKAEVEETEEKEQKVVSAIDKIKSEYLEKKEKRNDFAALANENKTIENIKEFLKADNECEKAYKKYESALNKHINYVTGHEYSGNNLKTLNNFMKQNNYTESAWLGSYQAKKVKLQLKKNAKPVIIQVFHENIDGTIFKMSESVYNIADFEKMKKIEETNDFKNIVDELKKAV